MGEQIGNKQTSGHLAQERSGLPAETWQVGNRRRRTVTKHRIYRFLRLARRCVVVMPVTVLFYYLLLLPDCRYIAAAMATTYPIFQSGIILHSKCVLSG